MILDLIAIFKARKDPALAAQLGSRFATEQALDKIGWPLVIAKFWMALALVICALLITGLIYLTYQFGWGFLIPLLLPSGIAYGITKVWRGLNAGLGRVKESVGQFTDRQIDRISLKNPAAKLPPSEP